MSDEQPEKLPSEGLPTHQKKAPAEQKGWRRLFKPSPRPASTRSSSNSLDDLEKTENRPEKWTMGILNDKKTEEVPGTVLLLAQRNEPLGLQHRTATASASSLPSPYPPASVRSTRSAPAEPKKTADGQILLDPQPDDSLNDPLNWPTWRRDCALLSLGFYCMLGGGMTPILAAGFNDVAHDYGVSYSKVALTTGLYMMGLGVGCVIFSPTAILFGKRPVYLFSSILFVLSSIWCAKSPNYASLVVARVVQGIAVSPVECLPSASIAEIFFLHERAFRLGIYTLLLLGGKNLVPLVSAVVIGSLSWRWVFWIVAIIVGFGGVLLFLFVPETFWDRTPRPKPKRPHLAKRSISSLLHHSKIAGNLKIPPKLPHDEPMTPKQSRLHRDNLHVGFADPEEEIPHDETRQERGSVDGPADSHPPEDENVPQSATEKSPEKLSETANGPANVDGPSGPVTSNQSQSKPTRRRKPMSLGALPSVAATLSLPSQQHGSLLSAPTNPLPDLRNFNSPYYLEIERNDDYLSHHVHHEPPSGLEKSHSRPEPLRHPSQPSLTPIETPHSNPDLERGMPTPASQKGFEPSAPARYTTNLRQQPPKTFTQTLRLWNGRLNHAKWWRVMVRPFILFTYPAVLWSSLVYSLSIGWLIVLSESVANIYRNKESYNFSALGTGLVYISPFIGGILGTAVAGKVSDILVRAMSRRNGGVYEPEFRLVMGIPVAITTAIGLMGFGWSAQEKDQWIVPTIFFGIISFGCSLGSTTSITFCVDSYRQYAGEALVTLNFSKNIFHGLVFSLFFPKWLEGEGPKDVFLAIGGIQVACLLTTIPMYIYGKRARMNTVRRKWMDKF
ncbi:MAG: hypothetical protein Q9227_006527 [Pyrenula ochraceoflavens]